MPHVRTVTSVAGEPSETQSAADTRADTSRVAQDICREVAVQATGMIPFVGDFMGAGLGILWNALFPSGGVDIDAVWRELRGRVQELVEQVVTEKLTEHHLATMRTHFLGISKQVGDYQKFASIDEDHAHILRQWTEAYGTLDRAEPVFRDSRYSLQLLPDFVQLANFQFLMLRDMVLHGERWGAAPSTVRAYKEKLSVLTSPDHDDGYARYVKKQYQIGLEKHPNELGSTRPGYAFEMGMAALEYAEDFWPYMDLTRWPNGRKVERFREHFWGLSWSNMTYRASQHSERPIRLLGYFTPWEGLNSCWAEYWGAAQTHSDPAPSVETDDDGHTRAVYATPAELPANDPIRYMEFTKVPYGDTQRVRDIWWIHRSGWRRPFGAQMEVPPWSRTYTMSCYGDWYVSSFMSCAPASGFMDDFIIGVRQEMKHLPVKPESGRYYALYNPHSRMFMDLGSLTTAEGTHLRMRKDSNASTAHWRFEAEEGDYWFRAYNRYSGMSLHVDGVGYVTQRGADAGSRLTFTKKSDDTLAIHNENDRFLKLKDSKYDSTLRGEKALDENDPLYSWVLVEQPLPVTKKLPYRPWLATDVESAQIDVGYFRADMVLHNPDNDLNETLEKGWTLSFHLPGELGGTVSVSGDDGPELVEARPDDRGLHVTVKAAQWSHKKILPRGETFSFALSGGSAGGQDIRHVRVVPVDARLNGLPIETPTPDPE